MKLKLFLIFIMFLLALPIALAQVVIYEDDYSGFVGGIAVSDSDLTFQGTSSTYSGTGELHVKDDGDYFYFTAFNLTLTSDWEIEINWSVAKGGTDQEPAMIAYNRTFPNNGQNDETWSIERSDGLDANNLVLHERAQNKVISIHGYENSNILNLIINRTNRTVCSSINGTSVGCVEYFSASGVTVTAEPFHLIFGDRAHFPKGLEINISFLKITNLSADIIIDTTDPNITIIAPSPVNDSFSTSIIQVFNLTVIEDNLDTITLDFNGTNETGFVNDFSNFFSLTKNVMAEGLFTYQIHANDTSGNTFVSEIRQFTIDNTSPVITFTIPSVANDSVTDLLNITNININGFNINLDIANLTVFNATGSQIFINLTQSISSSTFTFVNSFTEIFNLQPDDLYTLRTCFIDSANSETCEEALMRLNTTVIPVIAVEEEAILPLERVATLAGMLVLFLVIMSVLFKTLPSRDVRK